MLTDGNYTDCGEHFVMYIVVKSLCCGPETNIILYINYTSIKKIFILLELNVELVHVHSGI